MATSTTRATSSTAGLPAHATLRTRHSGDRAHRALPGLTADRNDLHEPAACVRGSRRRSSRVLPAPVRRNADLAEVHTSWQGESNKVVREIRGFSYYDPLKAEGDETIQDVFTRMNRALRRALRQYPGRTTVCVSHGDPIKILRVGYSGKPLTADHVRAPDPARPRW